MWKGFPGGGSDSKESICSAEAWVCSLGWEDILEKRMATNSSSLAWRIPWTQEPDVLQSMGPQGITHNLVTNTHTLTQTHTCVWKVWELKITERSSH